MPLAKQHLKGSLKIRRDRKEMSAFQGVGKMGSNCFKKKKKKDKNGKKDMVFLK